MIMIPRISVLIIIEGGVTYFRLASALLRNIIVSFGSSTINNFVVVFVCVYKKWHIIVTKPGLV